MSLSKNTGRAPCTESKQLAKLLTLRWVNYSVQAELFSRMESSLRGVCAEFNLVQGYWPEVWAERKQPAELLAERCLYNSVQGHLFAQKNI